MLFPIGDTRCDDPTVYWTFVLNYHALEMMRSDISASTTFLVLLPLLFDLEMKMFRGSLGLYFWWLLNMLSG